MNADVTNAFSDLYGRPPQVLVRAPGRVNLIGEHTDYSLLPVLPFAIDRSVIVAAAENPRPVVEVDSLALPSPLRITDPSDSATLGDWHRYVGTAVAQMGKPSKGASLLIGGNLPLEGGLSSSSALTLAVIAALNAVWDLGMEKDHLVSSAIAAERATGVEGGMMDQTVIVRAAAQTALKISFDPPRTELVPIPPSWSFVVAYSGHPAPKGGEARQGYNRLVVTSRAAAALLARWSETDPGTPPTLSAVASLPDVMKAVRDLPERVTAQEAAGEAGVPTSSLIDLTVDIFDSTAPLPVRAMGTHVLTEVARVDAAVVALEAQDLLGLGRLLDESQASLSALGVSTTHLDQLVESMRGAGATGSRLTGAGLGGFALAVCPADTEPEVVAAGASVSGGPAFAVRPAAGLTLL